MPDDAKDVRAADGPGSSSPAPLGTSKILAAMNRIMARVGYVQKQGENKFHNYKYAGEGDLLAVLRPAMVEEGLLLLPSHAEKSEIDPHGNVTVLVEYTLAHKDGEVWPEKIRVYGTGNDRAKSGAVGDKGVYKAATGANKYLLFKLFQIETGDDPEKDADHDKAAPANGAQAPETPAKNAPGISKARQWVDAHMRDLHGSEDGVDFIARIATEASYWNRIRTVYPGLWTGPDQTGLHGEARKIAITYQCLSEFDQFVKSLENPVKEAAE